MAKKTTEQKAGMARKAKSTSAKSIGSSSAVEVVAEEEVPVEATSRGRVIKLPQRYKTQ
jgi:hypothetical protein